MAGYAPPPAEEYGDSDEDDFSFAPPGQTSYQYHNTSSNNIRSGGFNWDSPPVSIDSHCIVSGYFMFTV